MQGATAETFYSFRLTDLMLIATLVGNLALPMIARRSEKRETRVEREAEIKEQARRHEENKQRLDQMLEFKRLQEAVNNQRDAQVNLLTSMAATSAATLQTMDRRLVMIEDEQRNARRP